MSLEGLEAFELGAGYYASPIQQVRAVIYAHETARVSGMKRFKDSFSVAIDIRLLMAILQQIAANTSKRESC